MIRKHQNTFNTAHVFIDLLLAAGSYAVSYPVRFALFATQGRYLPFNDYMRYLWFIIPGYLVIFTAMGLYAPHRTRAFFKELWEIIKANAAGAVYILAMLYIVKEIDISRRFLFIFVVINLLADFLFMIVRRSVLHGLRRNGKNIKHVLLVGYSKTCEAYIERVMANPQWGYNVIGILDNVMEKGTKFKGVSVIGKTETLSSLLNPDKLDEVLITLKMDEYEVLGNIVNECEKSGVHTKFLPDYREFITTSAAVEDIDGLTAVNIRNVPLSQLGNRFVKRTFDIILSFIALVIAAIPMGIVALMIKLSSKGPVIYRQVRVGRHNKEFEMLKFRSMEVQTPDDEKKEWTTYNDPRVTKIGKFIRKTSIDELPQLFNVLKGDMSLVGPRPERPQFVEKFKEEIPRYNIKHQVRPGITGWAQVNGYRGDT
ncbi:MAG: undecaprenyl-phosphate glucose phosphotransferase, partial [Lachnospiraceae bacterium]|nr:undecaprenyl-phosphate glucose phosphotransferase [Lachnospiraceae bacterium]